MFKTQDETYDRILCTIDDDYHGYALRRLTFSPRPLLVEEVAEVVAITVDGSPT